MNVSTVVATSAGHPGTVWVRLKPVSFFSTLHKVPMQLMALLYFPTPSFTLSISVTPSLWQCASKVNGGGFSNSKEFPDEVLRFVRSHPVMYRPVLPQHRRPVLLQTEPGRRKLTQIAVDRVQAQDGHYHVLYIGTGTHEWIPFELNEWILLSLIQKAMQDSLQTMHVAICKMKDKQDIVWTFGCTDTLDMTFWWHEVIY